MEQQHADHTEKLSDERTARLQAEAVTADAHRRLAAATQEVISYFLVFVPAM
eukprot:SAG31_NODE_628_length_13432_cov_131.456086_8_plen_52_part_00